MNIQSIKDLGELYIKKIYKFPVTKIQNDEILQAYMAGFLEGLQFGKQLPEEGYRRAIKDIDDYFRGRINSFTINRIKEKENDQSN